VLYEADIVLKFWLPMGGLGYCRTLGGRCGFTRGRSLSKTRDAPSKMAASAAILKTQKVQLLLNKWLD
jgi:hypothetical protein